MTNPKKRLEKILIKYYNAVHSAQLYDTENRIKKINNQTINKFLKEFVHKDSLPSKDKIAIEIFDTTYYVLARKEKELVDKFAKIIRKLIEGKK